MTPLSIFNFLGGKAKAVAFLLLAAALIFLAAALVYFATVRSINSMVERAVTLKAAERDAFWKGEIEKSNRQVAELKLSQAREILHIEATASQKVREAETQLTQLEKDNAALPTDNSCGLGRSRVRLLNQQ